MKTLLKTSLMALALIVASVPLLPAATESKPADRADRPGRHPALRHLLKHRALVRAEVARKLDLTDDQKAQLKTQRQQAIASLKALRSDPNLTREQKRERGRQTMASARAGMRGILTPEQQTKLDQLRERLKQRRAGRV